MYTTTGIGKLISELDEHKACRPNGITPIVLKRPRAYFSLTRQCMFSRSFAEDRVPGDWQHGNATPLHKKGSRKYPAKYHPISLAFVCYKLMELIVVSNLMRHLPQTYLLRNPTC